jgi:hypothetical protein
MKKRKEKIKEKVNEELAKGEEQETWSTACAELCIRDARHTVHASEARVTRFTRGPKARRRKNGE